MVLMTQRMALDETDRSLLIEASVVCLAARRNEKYKRGARERVRERAGGRKISCGDSHAHAHAPGASPTPCAGGTVAREKHARVPSPGRVRLRSVSELARDTPWCERCGDRARAMAGRTYGEHVPGAYGPSAIVWRTL